MAEPTPAELAADIERQLLEAEQVQPPRSRLMEEMRERAARGPIDIREPIGGAFPEGDPEGALMEYFDTQFRRFVDEGYPEVEAAQRANEAARAEGFTVTPEIPGTPTSGESTLLAIQPRLIRHDRRPLSEAERLERGMVPIAQGLMQSGETLVPRSIREKRDELIENTIGFENLPLGTSDIGFETASETLGLNEYMGWDDRFPTGESIGLRAENQTITALRVIGHGLVSAVQELALKLPLPDVKGAGEAWQKGWVKGDTWGALDEMGSELWGDEMTALGEVMLGLTPEQRGQRIRRPESWWADWWQGVVEKVETGRGLETDFERGAKKRLAFLGARAPAALLETLAGKGPEEARRIMAGERDDEIGTAEEEWGRVGWWSGLFLDLGVGWEKAPIKLGQAVGSAGRRANTVRKFLPETWPEEIRTVMRAIASPEIENGEYFGRRLGGEIEDGVIDPMKMRTQQPELWHHANAVSLNEFGMTFEELLRVKGYSVAREAAEGVDEFEALRRTATPDAGTAARDAADLADPVRPTVPKVRLESMEDFWDLVRGESYAIPRHAGYDRLRHLEEGASARSPMYVLRNGDGDVVGTGTLQEMLELISRRGEQFGEFGDDIWFGTNRVVARWRTPRGRSGASPLAADYFFASADEAALVSRVKVSTKARSPKRKPDLVRRTVDHTLADVLLQGPFRRAIDTRELGEVGQVVLEAARLQVRRYIPARTAKFLANGALVAAEDVTRIHTRALRVLAEAGLDEEKLAREVLREGRALTRKEARALSRIADRYGVELDEVSYPGKRVGRDPELEGPLKGDRNIHRLLREGKFHPAHMRAVRNAVIGQVGAAIADTRYRLAASPGVVDALQTGLAFAWSNLRATRKLTQIHGIFGMPFERSVLETMSPQARQVFDKWRSKLERTTAELSERIRTTVNDQLAKLPGGKLNRRNPLARLNLPRVLLETFGDYAPTRPQEVRLAGRIMGRRVGDNPMSALSDGELRDLSQQVYQTMRRTLSYKQFVHEYDWVGSRSRAKLEDGLRQWATRIEDDAAHMAREYLLSTMGIASKADRTSNVADALRALPQEVLLQVWREVFRNGQLAGPWLRHAWEAAKLPKLGTGTLPLQTTTRLQKGEAMFGYMIRELGQRNLQQALEELAGEGVVFRPIGKADPRRDVLLATLQGTHTRTVRLGDGTLQTQSRFSPALQTWANTQLATWGVRAGSRQTTDTLPVPRGGEVVIPEHLKTEITRALGMGELDASAVFERAAKQFGVGAVGQATDVLVRAWKQWTLGVFLVPKMSHYIGQALGVVPILWTTRGLKGTLEAGLTLGRHPLMIGELMQRVAAPDHFVFMSPMKGGRIFETGNGAVYHVDELAEAARAGGLGDTVFKVETMQGLRSMLAGMDTGIMDPRRLVKTVKWWNEYLQEAAGSFDQLARMAVYLDEVQKGVPLAEAAITARRALLDFRDLTEVDQRLMRLFFSFYAFMRKNADAYTSALFRHPERVLAQMRLQHEAAVQGQGLLNLFDNEERDGLTEAQLGSLREEDIGRFLLYSSDEVVNEKGRVHPRYVQNRFTSTPLSAAEWLNTLRMFHDAEFRPGLNPEVIGDAMLPPWQAAMFATAGHQIGADWKPDSFNANRLPPFLMQPPFGERISRYLRVGAIRLRDTDDPGMRDPDASALLGEPAVWAVGRAPGLTVEEQEAAWDRWQNMRIWLSSPLGLAGQVSRATGHTEPKSNVTQVQEWLQLVGGFRVQSVESDEMIRARARRERTFEIRKATRRAEPNP